MKKRSNRGVLNGTNDRMLNGTPSEGGVFQESLKRCSTTDFPYLSHSALVVPYSSASPAPIQENREGRERPPKKAGDHVAPIAALSSTPLSGPMRGRSRPH